MSEQNHLAVPRSISFMFAPAPILEGEDSKAYGELLAGVSSAVKPRDMIEEMWVRDIVDFTWEIFRNRGYKLAALKAEIPKALEEVLAPFVNGRWRFGAMDVYDADGALEPRPSMELVNGWIRQDPSAIKQVNEVLSEGNLTMKDVEARAATLAIGTIERFERRMSGMEASRNGLLREIERRRDVFAQRLRRATRDAEEGEFEEVAPKAIALQNG